MQTHATDPGVFIRSMASRGWLGGLSRTANDAVDLLDAAGYDPIIVETVGVGQDEIEVARAADVVAVVLVPGMGDDVQSIKAGILEIADVFIINKADRPGADRVAADLEALFHLGGDPSRPKPAVFRTVATSGDGIPDVVAGFAGFLASGGATGRLRRRFDRAQTRFLSVVSERLSQAVLARTLPGDDLRKLVEDIAERRIDPYSAADRILDRVEVR
jgi:LAO/AO transport system kinase